MHWGMILEADPTVWALKHYPKIRIQALGLQKTASEQAGTQYDV